ncbi:hypothetical protein E2562_017523 [Oryza meyeriana var. granulata]|uniref:Uncharacterized protein n=1 Tax=Oryza meyeriana var. granulata TaxID=110450 RepID=A0A6G1DXX8_9ORYZ|nr:hypothetical protein E2562_017523 [Oryza meyeriana var. granulata]
MGSSHAGGEMCMEGGGRAAAGRRGGKKAAEQHKVAKQPQRGLGVAQLEKIRLHNQMVAALRSAAGGALHDDAPSLPPPPPFAAHPAMAGSLFHHQPYLTDCHETADHRRIAGVQPYEGMLPCSSSRLAAPAPAFVGYEVKGDQYGSSGQRQTQYYSWMSSSYDHSGGRSSAGSSSEELDLELRL